MVNGWRDRPPDGRRERFVPALDVVREGRCPGSPRRVSARELIVLLPRGPRRRPTVVARRSWPGTRLLPGQRCRVLARLRYARPYAETATIVEVPITADGEVLRLCSCVDRKLSAPTSIVMP